MKKICKNCKYYKEPENNYDITSDRGECSCKKFEYTDDVNLPLDDQLEYWDGEHYAAGFYVGHNFGCIHWEPNNNEIENQEKPIRKFKMKTFVSIPKKYTKRGLTMEKQGDENYFIMGYLEGLSSRISDLEKSVNEKHENIIKEINYLKEWFKVLGVYEVSDPDEDDVDDDVKKDKSNSKYDDDTRIWHESELEL